MSMLKQMITAFTADNHNHVNWDEHLGSLQMAYHSSTHSETGYDQPFWSMVENQVT
jgi:hypothetical protein